MIREIHRAGAVVTRMADRVIVELPARTTSILRCEDCGTISHCSFMAEDWIWREIGNPHTLCWDCFGVRLGRPIKASYIMRDVPINAQLWQGYSLK